MRPLTSDFRPLTSDLQMTRATIETAVRVGIPFALRLADGASYEVRARDGIALNCSRFVVVDERNQPHIYPLSTITAIRYLPKENGFSSPISTF